MNSRISTGFERNNISSGNVTTTESFEMEVTTEAPLNNGEEWNGALLVFEILNVLLICLTLWVLLCLIVYGTRTGRWKKKAGASTLNSGLVYVACTVAVAFLLPTLTTTEVLYYLKNIENGLEWCEFACDMGNIAFTISISAAYAFLWIRLRLIYKHPYVKQRISKYANYFSIFVFFVLVLATVALMCFYVIPTSYQAMPYGCTYGPRTSGNFFQGSNRNILVAVALFSVQSLVMSLAAYPVIRVKFEAHPEHTPRPTSASSLTNASLRLQKFVKSVGRRSGSRSPIQLAVRRTLICCVVMVISDIIVLLPVVFIIPREAPAQIRRTVYNVGSFVNIFCMLSTFGFTLRVLSLFCSPFPKTRSLRRRLGSGSPRSPRSIVKTTSMSQSSITNV